MVINAVLALVYLPTELYRWTVALTIGPGLLNRTN
jgi:hypothetical protein